ncbi:hypothetical protein BH11PSE11_BH11PSE11_05040 [soil metagenome]
MLGIAPAQIDPNERFSRHGLTSLTAAALVGRLAAQLDRSLPQTLVWDHPSPRRLAAFLCGESTETRQQAVSRMADDEPIAIVGLACRVPGAADPEAFWKLLIDGVEAVGDMPRDRLDTDALFDPDSDVPGKISTRRGGFLKQVDQFDAAFFGMSPREATEVDPQQRLILELAWEALERAGIAPSHLHGSRTGVFMGAMWSDYGQLAGSIDAIAQHSATGRDTGIIANRVSYLLGLTGPSMTVNTACSSSLVAVHLACRSLRSGESTLAFAGGVNLMLTPDSTVAMTKFGAMAPDGRSKAFDARANGYVRGEGAGIVLLKPLSRAIADGDPILALVRGSAINNDGPSNGLTAPSPDAQRAVLHDACADASIDPSQIDYVEAHGTGTMLGDPIEAGSLGAVLGSARGTDRPLLIGSAKTNVGHLEAAAGITGMIKAVLALGHRVIPPSLHFESPNPHIDFTKLNVRVVSAIRDWPDSDHQATAGVSSFGFGGTNAHVVLQAWEDASRNRNAAPLATESNASAPRPLVFVYSGNGAQWSGMGSDLFGAEPAFRAALEACDAAFAALDDSFSVVAELLASPDEARLANTVMAQVMMFSVQVGLTGLLRTRGVAPTAVIGHSLGEIAAAHAAGALSLREAAHIVLSRSRLQAQAAGGGAMAVIELPWNQTAAELSSYPAVVVAGANSPDAAIVSGPDEQIVALMTDLAARGIAAQRVRVDVAYHSPAMDPLCAPLAAALDGLVARDARIPFYSTVDAVERQGESLDAAYWVRNLREPVRFAETVAAAMAAMPDAIIVEMSPHPILARSIGLCLAKQGHAGPVLATLTRGEPAAEGIDDLLKKLSEAGVATTPPLQDRPQHLLTLSAKDADALRELAGHYAQALPDSLADACFTANTGRDAFAHRLALIASDAGSMRRLLLQCANGQMRPGVTRGEVQGGRQPAVTLCFGNGAPLLMGLDRLMECAEPFADAMHAFAPALKTRFGGNIPELLAHLPAAQPAVQRALALAVGYAFAKLLQAWGIKPEIAGAGHGLLTVDALSGAMPLTQAVMTAADLQVEAGVPRVLPAARNDAALAITFGSVQLATSDAASPALLPLQAGDAWHCVLDTLAGLFASGATIDWRAFDLGMVRQKVLLPTYAFQRRRFWPRAMIDKPASRIGLYALEWHSLAQRDLPRPAALVAPLAPAPAADGLPAALDQLAAAYAAKAVRGGCNFSTDSKSIFKQRRGTGLTRLAANSRHEDPDLFADDLLAKHPAAEVEITLIKNVGRNLAAILDGRITAFDVLFPDGSMDQLQALYEKSPFALTLAGWMRTAFAAATAKLASPRVIEVGAGTGGTTAHLLPLMPANGHYLFTDVSHAFLERATLRFGATAGFTTSLLDIEATTDRAADAGDQDIAIAVNVLHATRDLQATLESVRSQLRPGGLLLLGEITGSAGWLDLVFGLLEGWWRFEDANLRTHSALLSASQWQTLLSQSGFDEIAIATDDDRQSLIIARAGPLHASLPGLRLVLGNDDFARDLCDQLNVRGLAAELLNVPPQDGRWIETLVCDREQDAVAACDELSPLFADARLGRVTLLQSREPTPMQDTNAAIRQSARHAYALSAGAADPQRWGGTLTIVRDLYDAFPAASIDVLLRRCPEDALRLTTTGLEAARVQAIAPPDQAGQPVRPDRCYLITGGLGALGSAFVRWLFARGARHFALLGRQAPKAVAQTELDSLRSAGAQILVFAADVTDREAMTQVFAIIDEKAPPLAGVIHAAGSAADDPADAMSAKLQGAQILHALTRNHALELFLLFSSAAGTWGASGKPAYAAANAALDALAECRRGAGLPALSIAWGRFSIRGLLTAAEDAALAEMGMQAMAPEAAFDLAWRLTSGPRACAVIAVVDWPRFRAVCEARAERPLLRLLPKAVAVAPQRIGATVGSTAGAQASATTSSAPAVRPPTSRNELLDAVRETVAEVLGHESTGALSTTQGLFDLGLDSLLAVRLRGKLESRFGRTVPTAVLFSHPTIAALADWLADALVPDAPARHKETVAAGADSAIAVIGIGCRFPGGVVDLESFEKLLFDGVNAVTEVPAQRWNWRAWNPDAAQDPHSAANRWGGFLDEVDQFDAAFFGIAPKEAAFMDPQQRLLLETAWQAIEHAGIAPTSLNGADVGVYVGITGSDYATLARRNRELGLEAQAIVGQPSNASAGRISFTLGLTGPALVVDTACSSSLVAIHLACRALRAGDCSSALAGGVNLMLAPETSVILARAGMLSASGQCRAFDAGADGFVRAEGCGMVLLKPLRAALAAGDTVLAVVRGSAINHDGRASGFTVPNGSAQQDVMRAALDDAGLSANGVGYVEAHGTGTALGDPIEAHAIAAVFGGRQGGPLMIGSVKTNIGHAESAAGVAGFIKSVLALRRESIPPTLHFEGMNPHIAVGAALRVPVVAQPFPAIGGQRVAGVSAFGASGTNAHLLLEAAAPLPMLRASTSQLGIDKQVHLLALSARHADSLRELAHSVSVQLEDGNLAQVAYAAATSRAALSVRGFVLCENAEQGRIALEKIQVAHAAERPKLAFLFTGQGSQYGGMARGLYDSQPAFREVFDRCDAIASALLGESLKALVFDEHASERLDETCFAQPALFAIGCALAAVWRAHGVEPDVVLGHSVGEYAAAVSAGILTLESAMPLVVERGRLMQALPAGGGMLAVRASVDALLPWLTSEPELSLAAENGPSETVVSGPLAALEKLAEKLAKLDIPTQRLSTSHAFHSALLDPMLEALRAAAAAIEHAPARVAFISNLTGAVRGKVDAAYWAQHAREPVRFAQGLRRAQQMGCTVFIEIGPQAVLSTIAGRVLDQAVLIPSMRRASDERRTMLEAIGLAWQAGVEVKLPALLNSNETAPRQRIALPGTPFRRVRHWLEWAVVDAASGAAQSGRVEDELIYQIVWERRPLQQAVPQGNWLLAGFDLKRVGAGLAMPLAEQRPGEGDLFAQHCRALGFKLHTSHAAPEVKLAGVLWLAPQTHSDTEAAAACEALQNFVQQSPSPVWLVTRGAQAAAASDDIDFRAAALWGIGRALALQDLPAWGGMIDLPLQADWESDTRALANFLSAPGDEDQLALRAGIALVPRLEKMLSVPVEPLALQADRTYLVSGAFGGLGLSLVRHLIASGARQLALLGRHVPPVLPPELSRADLQIRCFEVDVADREAMRAVGSQVETGMPPVAGIFHVAGVKTAEFDQALHPKLGGAEVLHQISLHWPLQQFVLFSSAASVWGDSSLAAYAAANAALDGFAHWRRRQGLPALAINWSRFEVRGMLDDDGAKLFDRIGLAPIAADAAFMAMRRLTASDIAQATVAAVHWNTFAAIHRSRRARPLLARVAPLDSAGPVSEARALLPSPERVAAHSRAEIERLLVTMVASILGIEDPAAIDVTRGFFALGVDSFGIVDLRRRIEQELGVALPPSALFDAPNVAALAALLSPAVAFPDKAKPSNQPDETEFDPSAIVGTACRLPGGVTHLDALERLLLDGVDAVSATPAERDKTWSGIPAAFRRGGFIDGIAEFDADFFGISPREAMQIDPQHRLLLELAWQALENAGWSPPTLSGGRTGVFVGITGTEYADIARASGLADAHAVGGQFLNAAAGRLSHALGLNGPSLAVDTACSSSAMALHLACRALWAGECDAALAGGANLLLSPGTSEMLVQARMLSPHGRCATFDAGADGYVRAEGCALVVLKRLSRAQADGDRVLAVIRGTATNHDGASSGFTVPNGSAQQAVIRAALMAAQVTPADVSYVEAHGTGTSLGDPIELHALDAVFGDDRSMPLRVGSIKTHIGHAEAAAGVAGLLKLIVALRRRHLPAQLHFTMLNPHIKVASDRVEVLAHAAPWEPISGRRIAGLSAFGASGTNVHLILEEAPAPLAANDGSAPWVLALSARRADDLAALAEQVLTAADPLRACREATLVRSGLPHRVVAVGDDIGQIREQIRAHIGEQIREQRASVSNARTGKPKIAFLFTGQGAQYAGMARGLYESQPVFRAAIDRCAQAMQGRLPLALTKLLFEDASPLVATERVQPALFAVGYALAQLWRSWGVEPIALIGHSVGEITAACVAGVLDLDAAAQLVCERSRLMGGLPPGGAMAAVFAPAEVLTEALATSAGAVVVAARNGPANTVLSGEAAALDSVLALLDADGIRTHKLAVSHAFHSPLLDPMLDEFEQFVARLPMSAAQLPLVSNHDGAVRSRVDAAYWRAQARNPVAFAEGMATLRALGCDTFIEIGPQPVLCGMGRECLDGASGFTGRWIASLRQGVEDGRSMLEAAAAVWQAGAPLSWKAVLQLTPRSAAALPPYPFRRTRHWLDVAVAAPPAVSPIGRDTLFAAWTESPAFHGRMHSRTLGRADVASIEDSNGLVHVGLHMAFLSSALASADTPSAVAIGEVQFLKPLVLAQARELQILMHSDGTASLHAHEADGSWTTHMQAKVESPLAVANNRLNPDLIRAECNQELEASAFYADLQQKGFHLGPGLQRITRLWRRDGEVLALVAVSDGSEGDDKAVTAFGLPASLYEICAQVPAAAFPDQPHAYMLLGWDRMHRTALPASGDTWIHARVTLGADGLTLQAQIGLHANDGGLLARIDGAVFRRTVQGRAASEQRMAAWTGRLEWNEKTVAQAPAPSSTQWKVLATDALSMRDAELLLAARPDLFNAAGSVLVMLVSSAMTDETEVLDQLVTAVRSLQNPTRILLVTRGCWQVDKNKSVDGGAGVWGLAQAIRAERPDLHCRCVDLGTDADLLEVILAETGDDGSETGTAWTGARRFVARFAPLLDESTNAPQRLVVKQSGTLHGLEWQTLDIPQPQLNEVVIEVAAAAPGLRDSLLTYGVLRDGALGSDCAGTVLAVGAGVADFAPGDTVIAYAPHAVGALSTHVALPAKLVRHKPALISFAAAATIPVPYMTAWHGLVQRGVLKAGDTLLVHCAGSAVGLAAVAIARLIGARVIATASLPKHQALQAMGIEVIGDSRTTDFAYACSDRVDLAFGAFGAVACAAVTGMLTPDGRVIDLTRVGHEGGIDLDRLLTEQPEQFAELFDTVCERIAGGSLQTLRHEILPRADAVDALRRLSLGTVIGRLCLSFQPDIAQVHDGTGLLSGANGGIGKVLIPHLVNRGVTNLILLDRTAPDGELIDALQARGIRVLAAEIDICDESAMAAILSRAQQELPPICAIVHAAGAVADAALSELERTNFEQTFRAKVEGARLLDRLSRTLPIKIFALFSSVVSHLPSARQGAYAAANAALEQVARRRRADGLPATAICWGPWSLGIGDALGQRAQAAWSAWGVTPLSAAQGMALFDRLCAEQADTIVLNVDWERYCKQNGAVPPLLENFVARTVGPAASILTTPLKAGPALPTIADAELDAHVAQLVATATARVLRAANAAAIDPQRPFSEQGMDSLMATELAEELGKQLARRLPGTLIYNYPTPAALTAYFLERMRSEVTVAKSSGEPVAAEPASSVEPSSTVPEQSSTQPASSTDDYERRLMASLSRTDKLLGERT